MPSDYENGAKKTIDISIKAEKMTADVLKSALQEFMSGKAEKKGRMTYKQLQAKSPSKLDSIEVSDRNIGDFLKTARKYDVDFALIGHVDDFLVDVDACDFYSVFGGDDGSRKSDVAKSHEASVHNNLSRS